MQTASFIFQRNHLQQNYYRYGISSSLRLPLDLRFAEKQLCARHFQHSVVNLWAAEVSFLIQRYKLHQLRQYGSLWSSRIENLNRPYVLLLLGGLIQFLSHFWSATWSHWTSSSLSGIQFLSLTFPRRFWAMSYSKTHEWHCQGMDHQFYRCFGELWHP